MNKPDKIRSEFTEIEEDEIIHVKKIPPKNESEIKIKTRGFGMNFNPNSSWGEVRGEITHQYLKFVNAHVVERMNLIEKLIQVKDNLQREIELLQSNDLTELVKISDIPIRNMEHSEVKDISDFMKLQNVINNSKDQHYKKEVKESEHKKLENDVKQSNQESSTELDNLVKEELGFLIKKYGMKELTYAVDVITSSKLIKNNRDLQ